ncbi:MAG: hypothetical protein WC769_14090 [Thermodesulfovibrionales bacterium]|jgi:cytochrome c556
MESKSILAVFAALLFIISMMVVSVSTAGHDMHSPPDTETASGTNPLIEEMIILDNVFREVVSAVAIGDGERVHKSLHAMHGTMEKTHEGVHEGKVKIPKNADRQTEFVDMDKEFHLNLERLAEAGQKNDQAKMLSLTRTLLEGCVNCHRDFRK